VFLIVDDQTVRESLVKILTSQKIDAQGYMTAMEFYRDYREARPGMLVTEIHLRGMSGMELFEKIEADKIDLPVAFIAGHADSPLAIQGMKAGAFDFMTRPIEDNQLTALVARGYAIFYDVDWDFVGEDLDDIEKSLRRFTDREREILDLVVDGFSSREIAEQLGISPKTVEAHRARITDKMRSDSLAHLVRKMMVYNDNQ
jgi:FixJ family two-component response regulator